MDALDLLAAHHVQGIAKLRGHLTNNPSRDELRHGLLQARLAAQALLAGVRPVLEPPVGDLLLGDVLLEVRGLNRAGGGTSRRLVRAIELKAKQTRTAPAVWVWIEDDGAFAGLDDTAVPGLERVFATWPHLDGVVLSGEVPVAFPRAVHFGPQTVVHRPDLSPARYALIHRLCTAGGRPPCA
ncbi:hypothetical protein [Dactylosporangium sp. NPDC049140]|jgi:hypothetical protein|uniref:hypothetical protein n=1 Tax=Dactylosporangium sp. NPDC049140 TaxID=3155647 RepID=UPI0033CA52C2